MNEAELVTEIKTIEHGISALKSRKHKLESDLDKIRSIAFFKANNVTPDQIESPDRDKWFGNIWEYGEWLKENSTKRFCEWNGCVHFTSEVVNGRFNKAAPNMSYLSKPEVKSDD